MEFWTGTVVLVFLVFIECTTLAPTRLNPKTDLNFKIQPQPLRSLEIDLSNFFGQSCFQYSNSMWSDNSDL